MVRPARNADIPGTTVFDGEMAQVLENRGHAAAATRTA